MEIKKFAYFSKTTGATSAGNGSIMIPADIITGLDLSGSFSIAVNIEKTDNAADISIATLTTKAGRIREGMSQVTEALSSNPKDGFIVIADAVNSKFSASGNDVITDVSITL
jgi:hypothetical protein